VRVIALDTNVLVRLLTRDDARQAERARALLDERAEHDTALFVGDVVLAELAWTLERAYDLDRASIGEAIRALLDNVTLEFESRETLRSALASFESGGAGFPDCMIAAKAKAAGCSGIATFDKRMRDLPGVELL
jgi:predicted nucleic-acid-binding protein